MTTSQSSGTTNLKPILALTTVLREALGDPPLIVVHVFMTIMDKPGVSQTEIAKSLHMSKGAVSRTISSLRSIVHWDRRRERPGPDLIDERVDPVETRARKIYLNARGEQLAGAVKQALAGERVTMPKPLRVDTWRAKD